MQDVNCSAHLQWPAWVKWPGLSPSNTGRLAAALLVVFAIMVCLTFLRGQRQRLNVAKRARESLSCAQILKNLAPAFWSLTVFAALLAAFFASGFYRKFDPGLIEFLSQQQPKLNHPAEMAGRGIWAATFCAVILGSIAVAWVGARVYRAVECRQTASVLGGVLVAALVPIVGLSLLGKFDLLPAFGSETSALMLCSTWKRNDLGYLGPTTDGLNVVAISVAVAAAASFCLLLWGVRRATRAAKTLTRNRSSESERAFLARRLVIAKDASSIQVLMDYVLYAGAAALIAGLLEVVATLSWSFAPFPSTAELKIQADLCKAMQPATPASVPSDAVKKFCSEVELQLPMVATVDDLRKFTRSVGIMFGAVFSALLVAMYLPVALAQQELVDLLRRASPRPQRRDTAAPQDAAPNPGDRSEVGGSFDHDPGLPPLEDEPELDRSAVQRVFNVIAALGPLAVAIVSTVFGL